MDDQGNLMEEEVDDQFVEYRNKIGIWLRNFFRRFAQSTVFSSRNLSEEGFLQKKSMERRCVPVDKGVVIEKDDKGHIAMCVTDVQDCDECNLIEETIFGDNYTESCYSILILMDKKYGFYLNFFDILPPNSSLMPVEFMISQMEAELTQRKKDVKSRFESSVADLISDYKGQSKNPCESNDDFFMQVWCTPQCDPVSLIGYQNISKCGGVLNLLHEIAHGWQHALNDLRESRFFQQTERLASAIAYAMSVSDCSQEDRKMYENDKASCIEDEFAITYGGKFHHDELCEIPQNLIDTYSDHILLSMGDYVFLFFSKQDGYFDRIIKMRRWTERNAWFCALMIVRLFKKRVGFNIEPGMNNQAMIKHVHKCLQTYNKHIEMLLQYDCRKSMKYTK